MTVDHKTWVNSHVYKEKDRTSVSETLMLENVPGAGNVGGLGE